MREGKVRCSFCQKTEDQVRKLIAGPNGKYLFVMSVWYLLRDHGRRIKSL